MSIRSQKDLEMVLSKLRNFEQPSFPLEQYATPSAIAAEWIWSMALRGEVAGKVIVDAASGPGILGIGLLLLGATKIFFIDKDAGAMSICMKNYEQIKREYEIGAAEFIIEDISLLDVRADIVVQNPPFGTKDTHADKRFLEKAFAVAPIVYSMHKSTTKTFVEAIARDHGFRITHYWEFQFPIKAVFKFHEKPVVKIGAGLWRMEKR